MGEGPEGGEKLELFTSATKIVRDAVLYGIRSGWRLMLPSCLGIRSG